MISPGASGEIGITSIVIYQYNRSVLVSTKNPEVPVTRASISDKVDDLLFGYDNIAIGI